MKRTLKTLIGGIALSLFTLFAAPAAFATSGNYSGNCAGLSSWDGSGNATISQAGACTISQAVSAQGFIAINISGGGVTAQALTSGGTSDLTISAAGDITTGAIHAGGSFGASTSAGKISIPAAITTNVGGNNGNILLTATGNIGVGDISTSGGAGTGGVEIKANTSGTPTLFTVGSMTANGVASINTSNTTSGGIDPTFVHGGLFFTNGSAGSVGNITVTNMTKIQVNSSGGRSGIIYLNAQNGTLTLPTGSLNSDGANNQGAGVIILLAKTVTTVNGTIVTASQLTGNTATTSHGVQIAAQTINVAGASGLQIHADGNGFGGSFPAFAAVLPQGAITITSNGTLDNLVWTPSNTAEYTTNVIFRRSVQQFSEVLFSGAFARPCWL